MKLSSSNRSHLASHPRQLFQFILLTALLAVAGCTLSKPVTPSQGVNTSSEPQKLKVVATILPMYQFTKAVAGEVAVVKMLVPPGTEPHEYQSTPTDVQTIAQADVLVKNGLGLEEFLDDTVNNAQNSKLTVINATQGIQPLGEISPVVSSGNSPRPAAVAPSPVAQKVGGASQ
ncbi:MAG TPA: zinc ABC transporter substrate-binding protein, partial [Candidatus Caenarcaniphilales bacterium]